MAVVLRQRAIRWLRPEVACRAALLVALALALSKNQADPDLWGHWQYGRDLLAAGLPSTATYSFTATGHPWINHELLSEAGLYLGLKWLGPAAMLTLKCLVGVGLLCWTARTARKAGVSTTTTAFVLLLVAANLMHFWNLRPQLATFTGLFILFGALHWCFEHGVVHPVTRRRIRRLYWLPLLFAAWANLHGGFLAAWILLAVFLGVKSFTWWMRDRREAIPVAGHLALVLLGSAAATLINPYGVRLHAWLLDSLGSPRPEIVEWLPPELVGPVWLPFWILLGLLALSLLLSRARRDPAEVAVLLLLAWQAASHRRHIALLAVACAWWLPRYLEGLRQRLSSSCGDAPEDVPNSASTSGTRTRYLAGFVVWVALLVPCAFLADQLRQIPVRHDGYPVEAFRFMHERNLGGKLLIRFKWAQYAIAAFAADPQPPHMELFFDGRFRTCYPQRVVDAYFDFAVGTTGPRYRDPSSPPIHPERALEVYRPDLVLIDRSQEHAVSVMRRRADWVLLYQDGMAQLWGRSSIYDNPHDPRHLDQRHRRIHDEPQTGATPWPALPAEPTTAASTVTP